MNYSIRRLEISDINGLAEIMVNAFLNEPWKEIWDAKKCNERLTIFNSISSSLSFTLINENNVICGAAIGYVVPFKNKNEYDLQEFFIDPKLVGNHLGTFLMNELLEELKKANVDTVKFYTAGDLNKFYDKFGFEKLKNEYLMELNIK